MTQLHLLDEAVARHDDAEWSRHALELIRQRPARARPTPTCCGSTCRCSTGIDVYLKDESTHPTGQPGSTGWRARCSCTALCNGRIRRDTPIVEASSGSTAISEAYFARACSACRSTP